jgi:hypothetical protein|tara:strand:- start:1066 stop:1335 length:270 start_codon:yes stop_codon:yes gene_type:complete
MTEHNNIVEFQRQLLAAEEWSGKVKGIHAHSINSMWYDDRPQDTSEGKCVTDIEFNNGTIERTQQDGTKHMFGTALTGQALVDSMNRNT